MAPKTKRKKPASASHPSHAAKARKTKRGLKMRVPGAKDPAPAGAPSVAVPVAPGPFLGLASELRDKIYDFVLEICPTAFSKKAKHITSTSGLARVNKQIRGEFLSRALKNAPVLKTTVTDFNFSHVVTFLNNIPDSDLEALDPKDQSTPAERTMLIELKFAGPYPADLKFLARWLNRAAHVEPIWGLKTGVEYTRKRGADIKFQYTAEPAHPALYLPLPRPSKNAWIRDEENLLKTLDAGGSSYYTKPERRVEEADKIKQVLKEAHAEFERLGMRRSLNKEDTKYVEAREDDEPKLWPWDL